jgi:tRNA threonylcarbamoyladenosine biosynthesis protein TsaB
MLILALEQSTPTCSLALTRDAEVLASRTWTEDRGRNQQLFAELPPALEDAGVQIADIEAFAVGLGPGSFTGLRTAVIAARAFALPEHRPVIGVSSAEVLATEILSETGMESVTIVGDARRRRFWTARFPEAAALPSPRQGFRLVPASELAKALTGDAAVVSPDWDRIGDDLATATPPGAVLIREPRYPTAITLAELARRAADSPAEQKPPLAPIYLHPPVFVPPRFDAEGRPSGRTGRKTP